MDQLTRILCVDDNEQVRNTVSLTLRARFEVVTATDGDEALAKLALHSDIAVVVSDMWMPPGMNGITLLSRIHEQSPDTVCVLLTGQPELDTAIAAVNQGQIFRFLTKPTHPTELLATVDAAVAQHRLLTAERILLEQTLHGTIHALTDALSLASPTGFGRATRVKELVVALNAELGLPQSWQLEVAALLSQLACITLPAETVVRVCDGSELTREERAMVDGLPAVTEKLLGHIPRLEVVREILRGSHQPPRPTGWGDHRDSELAMSGAQVLRVALDFDLLYVRGNDPSTAIALLRSRAGSYELKVLNALAKVHGDLAIAQELRELPLAGLRVGMVLLDNVTLKSGMLLVCGGATITLGLLERMKNLPKGSVHEPVRVNVSPAGPQ